MKVTCVSSSRESPGFLLLATATVNSSVGKVRLVRKQGADSVHLVEEIKLNC